MMIKNNHDVDSDYYDNVDVEIGDKSNSTTVLQ